MVALRRIVRVPRLADRDSEAGLSEDEVRRSRRHADR
jgi:hypothetical protein